MLQNSISDLTTLLDLPAIWSETGASEQHILDSLADVLVRVLDLNIVYIRAGDHTFETLHVGDTQEDTQTPQKLRESLAAVPPGTSKDGLWIGQFGSDGDSGILATRSNRSSFPTEDEQLVLTVAANQAGVGLRQVRLLQERKQAVEALRQQKETLESLNRVGQVLASELDLERLVQSLTDAATELTGAEFGAFFYNVIDEKGEAYQLYTLSGVPRSAFEKFPMPRNTGVFAPTFRGEGVIRLANVREDPRYGNNPPYHGMPKGHLPVVSYLATPVISRSGEILGGLFFGHGQPDMFGEQAEDIVVGLAGQAAVAIDNARLFQQAQQAIRLRDEFLSIAAHELKTPLTTIKGYSQLLSREFEEPQPDSGALKDFASELGEQISRFEILVQDLLDVSRIQGGRLELRPEPVDLTTVASDVLARFEHAPERNELHKCVLDAPSPVVGVWDPTRIDEILTNLVSNALKYSPDGGEVRVNIRAANGWAEMDVSDEGMGITETDQAKVFKPFFRGTHAAGSIAGTGLGLYITAQMVEQHKGTIAVTSKAGEGTTISVRLPINSP